MRNLLIAAAAMATAHLALATDPQTLVMAFQPQENPEKLQLNPEKVIAHLQSLRREAAQSVDPSPTVKK